MLKKVLQVTAIVTTLVFINVAYAMFNKQIFTNTSVAGSGTSTSATINLFDLNQNSKSYSLHYIITGSAGVLGKFEGLYSNSGSNFVEPTGYADIGSRITPGTGFISFTAPAASFSRIKFTNSGTNPATVNSFLTID